MSRAVAKPRRAKQTQTQTSEPFARRDGHSLVLRTCDADMTSYGGFRWPESGAVEALDWKPTAECGNGLHGLLWGLGEAALLCWDADARWLVVDVETAALVDLDGKVKFQRGEVVYCGARDGAVALLIAHGADPSRVVAGTATAGDAGTATAGYAGTATAGYAGTATAGDAGTATAGYAGTATAGARGTATAGARGTATAGARGTVIICSWDEQHQRRRFSVGYIGAGGLEPNVPYRLDGEGRFVRAADAGGAK